MFWVGYFKEIFKGLGSSGIGFLNSLKARSQVMVHSRAWDAPTLLPRCCLFQVNLARCYSRNNQRIFIVPVWIYQLLSDFRSYLCFQAAPTKKSAPAPWSSASAEVDLSSSTRFIRFNIPRWRFNSLGHRELSNFMRWDQLRDRTYQTFLSNHSALLPVVESLKFADM